MRYLVACTILLGAMAAPAIASANTMDASVVPDGTYVVKIEKVDSQHMTILMNNGVETTVIPGGSADFTKLHPNESIKISMVKGKVPVYAVLDR